MAGDPVGFFLPVLLQAERVFAQQSHEDSHWSKDEEKQDGHHDWIDDASEQHTEAGPEAIGWMQQPRPQKRDCERDARSCKPPKPNVPSVPQRGETKHTKKERK